MFEGLYQGMGQRAGGRSGCFDAQHLSRNAGNAAGLRPCASPPRSSEILCLALMIYIPHTFAPMPLCCKGKQHEYLCGKILVTRPEVEKCIATFV